MDGDELKPNADTSNQHNHVEGTNEVDRDRQGATVGDTDGLTPKEATDAAVLAEMGATGTGRIPTTAKDRIVADQQRAASTYARRLGQKYFPELRSDQRQAEFERDALEAICLVAGIPVPDITIVE
jgi:hypothetical protein